jgi:TolA-binding protein
MSTVFVLKPIIDVLYNEVNEYKKEIERLNKIIDELRGRKTDVKQQINVKKKQENEAIELSDSEDDEAFAKEAEAPPMSAANPVVIQVEKQNENSENSTLLQEDDKNVKLIGGKDKKEYMKEYQRTYRKKQKEKSQKIITITK